jgi:hypothetical protein
MAKPILSISTLVEPRDFVTIDGTPYELRRPGELTLLEQLRLGRRGQELEALKVSLDTGDPGEEDIQTLLALLDEMCRLVLLAPAEIHARLSDAQKQAIVQAFMLPQRETAAPAAAVEQPATATSVKRRRGNRSTGESTSPA